MSERIRGSYDDALYKSTYTGGGGNAGGTNCPGDGFLA